MLWVFCWRIAVETGHGKGFFAGQGVGAQIVVGCGVVRGGMGVERLLGSVFTPVPVV